MSIPQTPLSDTDRSHKSRQRESAVATRRRPSRITISITFVRINHTPSRHSSVHTNAIPKNATNQSQEQDRAYRTTQHPAQGDSRIPSPVLRAVGNGSLPRLGLSPTTTPRRRPEAAPPAEPPAQAPSGASCLTARASRPANVAASPRRRPTPSDRTRPRPLRTHAAAQSSFHGARGLARWHGASGRRLTRGRRRGSW